MAQVETFHQDALLDDAGVQQAFGKQQAGTVAAGGFGSVELDQAVVDLQPRQGGPSHVRSSPPPRRNGRSPCARAARCTTSRGWAGRRAGRCAGRRCRARRGGETSARCRLRSGTRSGRRSSADCALRRPVRRDLLGSLGADTRDAPQPAGFRRGDLNSQGPPAGLTLLSFFGGFSASGFSADFVYFWFR